MIAPRWRKVLRDLWINKTRTLLVVLSIAVGVAAIGMVLGSQGIVDEDLPAAYQAIRPADAIVILLTTFDDEVVEQIRSMPEVGAAEGRRVVIVRFQSPQSDEWYNMQLFAVPNFDDIQLNEVKPVSGAWPPPEQTILIERSTLNDSFGLAGVDVGDVLGIETPDGKSKQVEIAGVAHDLSQLPAFLVGTAYGYITYDTLEWLGEPRNYNQLIFKVAEKGDDAAHLKAVGDAVQTRLERAGLQVIFVLINPPGEHPAQSFIDALSYILGAMGILSLVLSGFLIVNTLSAILTQQVRQIGIMKAVGARTGQVTAVYFVMVLAFGLLSLFVSVPLGMLGARALANVFAWMLNFDVRAVIFNPTVVALQVAIGLAVPLLAAALPVIRGSRTTVREAISETGLGKGQFGHSWLDMFVVGLNAIIPMERPAQISLRNTFRRKGRLALTLITLSLATTIFISIFSVRASLQQTLDDSLRYFDYDVQVQMSRPYRVQRLLREALAVEGVTEVESWGFGNVRRVRPDGTQSDGIIVYAPPADSGMIQPTLLEGRWLLTSDTNAIVINNDVLRNDDDIGVGSEITLKVNGRDSQWVVAGIVRSSFPQPALYINYDYYSRVSNAVGMGQIVMVRTTTQADQAAVGQRLQEHFQSVGLRVDIMQTVAQLRGVISTIFNIVILFLLFMAVLLGAVGGLGLMGTMSINVIERSREIGVMRAIGASDAAVLRIILLEGAIIGLLSWVIGGLIAIPASRALSKQVGLLLLNAEPNYIFSIPGTILWLVIVILLSVVASYLPARSASRVTVREVLSYE